MKRLLLLCFALCLPAAVTTRATEPTDLGQGLSYLRVHTLEDLGKAAPLPGALVLDLRYDIADNLPAATLSQALARRPTGEPLFILVSPATPARFAPIIDQSAALTLGAPGTKPAPKVGVQTDAATDRRAYDALDTGNSLPRLVTGKIKKERFDEATLVHEFNNGYPETEPLPGGRQAGTVLPPPDSTGSGGESEIAEETPLVDHVLQRAVHLHRALLALHP